MKKRKSHIMSPAGTALVLLLGILLAAMTTLALEQGSLLSTLESFQAEPVLFVLNLWPVAAMALLVYFLLGNAWYSVSFTTLVWGLLSYVNLVKVEARVWPALRRISSWRASRLGKRRSPRRKCHSSRVTGWPYRSPV